MPDIAEPSLKDEVEAKSITDKMSDLRLPLEDKADEDTKHLNTNSSTAKPRRASESGLPILHRPPR